MCLITIHSIETELIWKWFDRMWNTPDRTPGLKKQQKQLMVCHKTLKAKHNYVSHLLQPVKHTHTFVKFRGLICSSCFIWAVYGFFCRDAPASTIGSWSASDAKNRLHWHQSCSHRQICSAPGRDHSYRSSKFHPKSSFRFCWIILLSFRAIGNRCRLQNFCWFKR